MNKKKIAIVTGGFSDERVISLKSCSFVLNNLNRKKYDLHTIIIDKGRWYEESTGLDIDKNDFSLNLGTEKILFDGVYLIIHGPPVEDGQLQAYFNLLGIPHSTCDTFSSALCFNKQATKSYLTPFGIPMAQSIMLHRPGLPDESEMKKLGFPVFVKPNCHGSSFGISKAKSFEELLTSCELAYKYDSEILVESFMEGREFSCGVVRYKGEITALPVTEIISETEFFDFAAKYEHKSQEITPADLTDEEAMECRSRAAEIYRLLNCRGMVRVDFILHQGTFKMLEVNTVPGLSPESIIPAQARAYGWTYSEFLEVVLNDTLF
ncbi:MAG: D-alanine--D-alanine ligase [Saprospirales bacterium]|nr:MAG: D-alanine--D-alanine ligase [Saprospirales bacterium]